jgi:hypothetical protein
MQANLPSAMTSTLEFMLGTESISGKYIEQRIDKLLKSGACSVLYKPRSGQVNSNLKYFSEEQFNYVKEELRELLHIFGYAKAPGEENPTGFFEYSD